MRVLAVMCSCTCSVHTTVRSLAASDFSRVGLFSCAVVKTSSHLPSGACRFSLSLCTLLCSISFSVLFRSLSRYLSKRTCVGVSVPVSHIAKRHKSPVDLTAAGVQSVRSPMLTFLYSVALHPIEAPVPIVLDYQASAILP